jgi:hypothetical protein
MRRALIGVLALSMCLLALETSSAGARSSRAGHASRFYYCTATIRRGSYAYGVIFGGANQASLVKGCRIFAGSSYRLQWGIHHPSGWVMSAQYIHAKLGMIASLIAPRAEKNLIFRLMNKPVFINHGWTLVRRL